MRCVLGIDCGLSVGKAAVFDESGRKLSEARMSTPLKGLEMDCGMLWRRIARCVREATERSGAKPEEILAVGLSGHGNGLYALDGSGEPVCAMSSMFDANRAQVDAFRESDRYPRYYELTKQCCWGGQPMQILRHLKRSEPERYSRINRVLLCKDFLCWRLTGAQTTDASDFSASAMTGGGELCELLGIPEMAEAMPEPIRCDSIAGTVCRRAAAETGLPEGTPVVAGGIDLFACMLGAGVAEPGICSVTAGTWGIAAALSETIRDGAQLTQECAFLPELPPAAVVSSPTSCVNLDWFIRSVRPELDYDGANAVALSFAPEDVRILFLPYIHRDMARPEVACSFRNLSAKDTWREMLRAVFEGVCFAHRLQIDRLRRAGVAVERVRMSGGATHSEAWLRLMCDVLGVEIEVPAERQAGLLGAAMMAAVGAGLCPTLRDAVGKMSAVERRLAPRPSAAYEEKYREFLKMVGDGR